MQSYLHVAIGSKSTRPWIRWSCILCALPMKMIWHFRGRIWSAFVTVLFSKTEITDRTRILVLVHALWDVISKIYWQLWHLFLKKICLHFFAQNFSFVCLKKKKNLESFNKTYIILWFCQSTEGPLSVLHDMYWQVGMFVPNRAVIDIQLCWHVMGKRKSCRCRHKKYFTTYIDMLFQLNFWNTWETTK